MGPLQFCIERDLIHAVLGSLLDTGQAEAVKAVFALSAGYVFPCTDFSFHMLRVRSGTHKLSGSITSRTASLLMRQHERTTTSIRGVPLCESLVRSRVCFLGASLRCLH